MSSDLIQSGEIARYFIDASKPASEWTVGPEIELFGFNRGDLSRITPEKVQAVIEGFSERITGREIEDGYVTEAALDEVIGGRITLEPGGQIEFSGPNHRSLASVERSLRSYASRLVEIGESNGVLFVASGFDPLRSVDEQRWIPKRRYDVMRPYLARRGKRAWDMMCRTAAIQVNLDYGDVEDLAKKFTLATRLAPISAAIFANSPFERGKL
ncbi:MAG TPA: glutamate-cysteine ligase family protein, partial [Blastocatellia bacterium]|nr:glutamate-cysteine ligase family protein [Blastocatellia bacterium]